MSKFEVKKAPLFESFLAERELVALMESAKDSVIKDIVVANPEFKDEAHAAKVINELLDKKVSFEEFFATLGSIDRSEIKLDISKLEKGSELAKALNKMHETYKLDAKKNEEASKIIKSVGGKLLNEGKKAVIDSEEEEEEESKKSKAEKIDESKKNVESKKDSEESEDETEESKKLKADEVNEGASSTPDTETSNKEALEHFEFYDVDVAESKFDIEEFCEAADLNLRQAEIAIANLEDTDIMEDLVKGDYDSFDLYDSDQFNDEYRSVMKEIMKAGKSK